MSKLARYIIIAAITAVILFLVWYFSNVVAYVLVAAVLAIIGTPLTDRLASVHIGKKRLPRAIAALITLITLWIVVIAVFSIFVPVLFGKINELAALDFMKIIDSFHDPLMTIERFIENTFFIRSDDFSIIDILQQQITPVFNISAINRFIASVVSAVGSTLIAVFSISFITFFFLKENNLFRDMVVIMFPKKYEENVLRAMDSTTNLLIRYFTGILAQSTIMTLIVLTGLLILGFPMRDALIIGLFVGVLNVIPYIGPLIAIGIGIFIGVVGAGPDVSILGLILRIAGTILFAQGVDNFILQPVLFSNRARAHPLEIFLVILIAGSLAGIWGMLLAIPAYNVIRVFAKEFFNNLRVVQKLTRKI